MATTLLSNTTLNLALDQLTPDAPGDLLTFLQGDATDADRLAEWAARLCYHSTARMGTAPTFIQQRIREGHEDVVEHATVTFRVRGSSWPLWAKFVNRYVEVMPEQGFAGEGGIVKTLLSKNWVVTGNLRVWLDLLRQDPALDVLPTLKALAPATFAEFPGDPVKRVLALYSRPIRVPSFRDGPLHVALLGASVPDGLAVGDQLRHGAATFLIEGVSRTATHQLVRHRLGSFSQSSQRYVSLAKGGWQPIMPPAVAANLGARVIMQEHFALAADHYGLLRELGIRAEDARFLLPGAADSRLIMSLSLYGWQIFLNQRRENAAQWEIRAAANAIQAQLATLASHLF